MSALRLFQGDGSSPPAPPRPFEPPKGFAAIPHRLTARRDVSDRAYRVLAALCYFWRDNPSTDATDSQLGAFVGRSREYAAKAVAELTKAGLVTRRTAGPIRRLHRTDATSLSDPSASDRTHTDGDPSASDRTHKRVHSDTLARRAGHPSASEPTRSLEGTREKSENPPSPSDARPGVAAPPTPAKRGTAPPDRPPAPPPKPDRGDPEPPESSNVLCPEEVVMMGDLAAGGRQAENYVARMQLAAHRRAVAWFEARGLPLPEVDAERRASAVKWMRSAGRTLPPGDDRCGKTPAPGTLGKVSPGAGRTDHPR